MLATHNRTEYKSNRSINNEEKLRREGARAHYNNAFLYNQTATEPVQKKVI